MSEPISAWERQWPEVFASLDVKTWKAVVGVLANHALRGWSRTGSPSRTLLRMRVVRSVRENTTGGRMHGPRG